MNNHAKQFGCFRVLLGLYLTIFFVNLYTNAAAIYGSTGVFKSAYIKTTFSWFPNIINIFDSPDAIKIFMLALISLSILLTLGIFRPWVAFLLWFGWACLFNRNNYTTNPSLPFIGWLLLLLSVIPNGEYLSLKPRSKPNWEMPKIIIEASWYCLGLSYLISGIDKLKNSISWQDGSALKMILETLPARQNDLTETLLHQTSLLSFLTWMFLISEILFFPMILFKKLRKWPWLLMTLNQMGIMFVFNMPSLTLGMLLFHIFLFDPNWCFRTRRLSQD